MKKTLIALIFAGISLGLGAQPREEYTETNPYRFIPRSADWRDVYKVDLNGDSSTDIFWYDKNRDKRASPDELFYEMNDDEIPDLTYDEFQTWRRSQLENNRNQSSPEIEPSLREHLQREPSISA